MMRLLRIHFNEGAPPAGPAEGGGSTSSGASESTAASATASAASSESQSTPQLTASSPYSSLFEMQVPARPKSEAAAIVPPSDTPPAPEPARTPENAPPATAAATTATPPADTLVDPRLAALEKELEAYKAWEPVIQSLRQTGHNDGKSAIEAVTRTRQEQQEQTLQQQREEAFGNRLKEIYSDIVSEYAADVENGLLTQEQANERIQARYAKEYERTEQALKNDWLLEDFKREREAYQAQQQATQATDALSRASAEFPVLALGRGTQPGQERGFGENLVYALHSAGFGDIPQLAGYVQQMTDLIEQKAVADYVAGQQKTNSPAAPPVPVNGNGGAPPPGGESTQSPTSNGFDWAKALGIKR